MATQLAASRMPSADGVDPRLEEAAKLVNEKDFLGAPSLPVLSFSGEHDFGFPSPLPSPFDENNTVMGRIYRTGSDWPKRPAVILVHGWNDATSHFLHFPMLARKMERAGMNVVTMQLPYHFGRRPRARLGAASNFLSADILRVAQAAAQAVAELRAITRWLKEQGCPKVGLLGVSLGGWLSGLTACHEPALDALALIVPATRLDRLIEELAFCKSIRAALQGRKLELGRLNLLAEAPLVARDKILLVEAEYDGFIPKDTIEELRDHWSGPEIWRISIGHITVLWMPGLMRRLVGWMEGKLTGRAGK